METLNKIKKLLCNTPLIEIKYKYKDITNSVYAKCEFYSLTGSIKDKVAYQIISDAYNNGTLKKGDKIVEVSSGNMGISLCAIGNLTGNPITIIMPKNMSEERKKLIRLYGATLIETEDFKTAFELCNKLKDEGFFCTEQFKNTSNIIAHQTITSTEILSKSQHLQNIKQETI